MIITKDKSTLINGLNKEKLASGPTIPRPGPILLKVAATALNADVKSGVSILITKTTITKIKI